MLPHANGALRVRWWTPTHSMAPRSRVLSGELNAASVPAAGSRQIAVMAKAGHASMTTTKRYLHLAGIVFRDEAESLERRMLGRTIG